MNEARRSIIKLTQSLVDISQNIQDYLNALQRKKEEIVYENIQKKIGNNFVAKQAAEETIK